MRLRPVPAGPVHSCVGAAGRFAAVCCVRGGGVPRDIIIIIDNKARNCGPLLYVCMYVKIRRHQHTRVHAHTGPRHHARAPACHRHHIPRLLVRRQAFHTTDHRPPSVYSIDCGLWRSAAVGCWGEVFRLTRDQLQLEPTPQLRWELCVCAGARHWPLQDIVSLRGFIAHNIFFANTPLLCNCNILHNITNITSYCTLPPKLVVFLRCLEVFFLFLRDRILDWIWMGRGV